MASTLLRQGVLAGAACTEMLLAMHCASSQQPCAHERSCHCRHPTIYRWCCRPPLLVRRLDNAKQVSRLRSEFEAQARAIQTKYEAQLRALHQAAEQHYAEGAQGGLWAGGGLCCAVRVRSLRLVSGGCAVL